VTGQSFTLAFTNPRVPGYPAVDSGFTFAFDCGSGIYATSSATASANCSTSNAGALAVRGKVIDRDGDAAAYTATVTVRSSAPPPAQAITQLRADVVSSGIIRNVAQSLTDKLDEASAKLAKGKSACSPLGAFGNQVNAQSGKAIPRPTAGSWLVRVGAIETTLRC
jgi:hypothetical protein